MLKNSSFQTKNLVFPGRWIRTSRRHPCPICGKYGFCEVTGDNQTAHCMSVPSTIPMQHRLGGWIHELTPASTAIALLPGNRLNTNQGSVNPQTVTSSPEPQTPPPTQPLSDELLDRINRAFLKLCPLNQRHRTYLHEVGVDPGECGSLNYSQAARLAHQLVLQVGEKVASRHPSLLRVTRENGRYYWTIAGATTGLLFPAVNLKGQILGIQIRKNWPRGKEDRYRWLSHGGLGGTPLSVFKAASNARNKYMIIITEGYKKAALASKFWECHAISLAGVSAYREEELLETVRELEVVVVALAFDQDKRSNPLVSGVEQKLLRLITAALPNCQSYLLNWNDTAGKGIDDALLAFSRNRASTSSSITFRLEQVKF